MKRLLIADDDPIYRDFAVEALAGQGFDIAMAADGLKAAAELAEKKYDIAIVDMNMPGIDGLQVIRHTRKSGPNMQTPIIVITGQDDATAVTQAYDSGATSFLTKPLNWILFTPHIQFVLRAAETEAELRQATEMADFLSKLKSQMMAALAQEFQAPIKSIFAFSELIRKEAFGPLGASNYIDIAEQLGQSSVQLNSSLLKMLSFGQSLADHVTLRDDQVSLEEFIDEAISAHEMGTVRRGVSVKKTVETPPDLKIKADRVLMSQAIRSLIGNAIRFAPRGSVVEITASLNADGALTITTSDKSAAMSPETLAELSGSASKSQIGLRNADFRDVGISIAKVLIEAHQGALSITQSPDAGTKVSFNLPKDRIVLQLSRGPAAAQPRAMQPNFTASTANLASRLASKVKT